jgi:hypothetical protein
VRTVGHRQGAAGPGLWHAFTNLWHPKTRRRPLRCAKSAPL